MRKEVIGTATLYLGDCLEVLPTLAPADAVITDPPYGIDFEHGGFAKEPTKPITDFAQLGRRESQFSKVAGGGHRVRGDTEPFNPSPWLGFAALAFWGANHYANRLPIEPGCGWLFWDKVPVNGYEGRWSFSDGELCWFKRKFALRTIRHYWNGGIRPDGEEQGKPRFHPTQKPVRVMAKAIELCRLSAGAVILDPYMGSGTTGVAATRLGHPFVGVEIDERYFSAACERIENEQRQERLFA